MGHVEFYNPAVEQLLRIEQRPGFVEIHRLAAFSPRSLDVDVVLDLMIHDLQILHALDDSPVAEVRATGISVLSERIDIANARIALTSGCVANLTASRVSAERVRKLRAFLPSRGYYSVDYQEQEIKGFRLAQQGSEREILPDPLEVEKQEPLKTGARVLCRRVSPAARAIGGWPPRSPGTEDCFAGACSYRGSRLRGDSWVGGDGGGLNERCSDRCYRRERSVPHGWARGT